MRTTAMTEWNNDQKRAFIFFFSPLSVLRYNENNPVTLLTFVASRRSDRELKFFPPSSRALQIGSCCVERKKMKSHTFKTLIARLGPLMNSQRAIATFRSWRTEERYYRVACDAVCKIMTATGRFVWDFVGNGIIIRKIKKKTSHTRQECENQVTINIVLELNNLMYLFLLFFLLLRSSLCIIFRTC